MNKIIVGAAAVLVAVGLAGCSSTPKAAPKPTQTVAVNEEACYGVATASLQMAQDIVGGQDTYNEFMSVRAQFDTAGLSATGDVKTRIESLVTNMPSLTSLGLPPYPGLGVYNVGLQDIQRACEAVGEPVEVTTIPQMPNQ